MSSGSLIALFTTAAALTRSPQSPPPFNLIHTEEQAAGRFYYEIAGCQKETHAFAALLQTIADSVPLRAQAVDSSMSVLFGTPADNQTAEPLFIVDLSDIARLPTQAQIRGWAPDSNWAWTRCEVIAHELAEAIAYRDLWGKRPLQETPAEANALFGSRERQAHLVGLKAEADIAHEQKTRQGTDGSPYSRTRECFRDGAVHVLFGDHTETVTLGAEALPRFIYYPRRNMCAAP